jgi:NAD-dependent SIR2 family protein deacetylase
MLEKSQDIRISQGIGQNMAVEDLRAVIEAGGVLVLSGAGMSTGSGIPDYRGPNGAYARGHQPMTYQNFLRNEDGRRRYWARSHVGWNTFSRAQPNAAHVAVAQMERDGFVDSVITQNVDGLHQSAGSSHVIDLHGRLNRVICLNCGAMQDRTEVHERLVEVNPDFSTHVNRINPDGDYEIPDGQLVDFKIVSCKACQGILKPDVVYFGESVPVKRVDAAFELVNRCSTLLVLGSSLMVYSGRRFVDHAHKNGKTVVIINQGETRCDHIAAVRMDADVVDVLPTLMQLTRSL